MSVPVFLVGMGDTPFDDKSEYKKVGQVSANVIQHFAYTRRIAEAIRSPFGVSDIFRNKMVNKAMQDVERKLVKYAKERNPNVVAISDATIIPEVYGNKVTVSMSGNMIVPVVKGMNNSTKKNRSSRKSTRKASRRHRK
jgi:hypothetical protein